VGRLKRLIDSPSVTKYKNTYLNEWDNSENIEWFKSLSKEKPLLVGFHFIRDSRRRYDFINALQLPLDLMHQYGWIDDDNVEEILPVPLKMNGHFTTLDKEHAGVLFKILNT
jgi:hypothetical protein